MKYEVLAIRKELNDKGEWEISEKITLGTYETELDAEIAIEEAIDEDLEYGEYDNYEYKIKRVTEAA